MTSIPNYSEYTGYQATSQEKHPLGDYKSENTYSFNPSGFETQSHNISQSLKPCHISDSPQDSSLPKVFAPPFVQQGLFQADNKENSIAPTPFFPTLPGQSKFSDVAPSSREFEFEKVRSTQREEPIKYGGIVISPDDMLASKQNEGHWNQGGDYYYQQLHGSTYNKTDASLQDRTNEKPLISAGLVEREFDYSLERSTEHEKKKGILSGEFSQREFDYSLERPTEHEAKKGVPTEKKAKGGKWTSRASNVEALHSGDSGAIYSTRSFDYSQTRPVREEEHVKPGGIIINPEDALPERRKNIIQDSNHQFSYQLLGQHKHSQEGEQQLRSSELSHNHASEEPRKYGSILINPEDALPERRQDIIQDSHHQYSYQPLHSRSSELSHGHTSSQGFESRHQTEEPKKHGAILINPEDVLPSKLGDLKSVVSHSGVDSYYYAPLHSSTNTNSSALNDESILNLDKTETKAWISNPIVSERLQERNEPFKKSASKPYQFKDAAFLSVKNVVSEDFTLPQKKGDKENILSGGISKAKEYGSTYAGKQNFTIKEGGYDSIYSKPSAFGTHTQNSGALANRSGLNDLNTHVDDLLSRSKGFMSHSSVEAKPTGYSNDQSYSSYSNLNYSDRPATSNSSVFERSGLYDIGYNF